MKSKIPLSMQSLLFLILVVFINHEINAFVVVPKHNNHNLVGGSTSVSRPPAPPAAAAAAKVSTFSSSTTTALNMCICINCARVTNCGAYHFVEERHEQPHMTENPTFEPRDGSPTIHVNIRTIQNEEDRQKEIERMWREHKAETERAMAKAEQEQQQGGEEKVEGALYGETTYDLSGITTYEYDVVECEDFVEDKGCWVRNMPQEIRDANPNFVPS